MRGKVNVHSVKFIPVGITPAHAGKRLVNFDYTHHIKDHPRTCGEKEILAETTGESAGSPPHMRGKVIA